jgi:hypothetical protein
LKQCDGSGGPHPVSVTVGPNKGDLLVYTDSQGSPTTIEITPGTVPFTTTFVYTPLSSPTPPLPPGSHFANHAFDLDTYCQQGDNMVYLPLIMRGCGAGAIPQSVGGSFNLRGTITLPCSPTFQKPITVTIHYSDADVAGLDENDLRLYYWTGALWDDDANTCTPASTYTRDTLNNVLSVPICHSSRHALATR